MGRKLEAREAGRYDFKRFSLIKRLQRLGCLTYLLKVFGGPARKVRFLDLGGLPGLSFMDLDA